MKNLNLLIILALVCCGQSVLAMEMHNDAQPEFNGFEGSTFIGQFGLTYLDLSEFNTEADTSVGHTIYNSIEVHDYSDLLNSLRTLQDNNPQAFRQLITIMQENRSLQPEIPADLVTRIIPVNLSRHSAYRKAILHMLEYTNLTLESSIDR
jgi:hypothetical protein